MLNNLASRASSFTPRGIGVVVGGSVLIITLFIQLVVLGLILPSWGDGNGLVPGQDVVGFHQVAVEQALLIKQQGWSAWELRPHGWGISGLMSVWYALTIPEPWALAPWQALMYGICAWLLATMINSFCKNRKLALVVTLPMILMPSAAMIYAQPHRDIVVMFALVIAIYGWWLFTRAMQHTWRRALGYSGCAIVLIVCGLFLAWAVRDFSSEIFQGVSVIMMLILCWISIGRIARNRCISLAEVFSPLLAVMLVIGMSTYLDPEYFDRELASESQSRTALAAQEFAPEPVWHSSPWLPSTFDDKLRRLSGAREHFVKGYSHGRTLLDGHVSYRSAGDMLIYTPRALQIGLFSPFPYQWHPDPDAPPVRNTYRILAGGEMLLLYMLLPFLAYAVYCWWSRPTFWVLLVPALSWVLVYSLSVPVVGALVRYRFPGYVILVMLAMAGLYQFLFHWRTSSARMSLVSGAKQG